VSFFSRPRRRVATAAIGAVTVLTALGGATAAYAAATTTSTPTSPATPAASSHPDHPRHGRARGLLERSDHTTVEVKAKGQWVTFTIDRGKVTSTSANSISLARPDGQSVTINIAPTTKYRGVSGATAVQVGKSARVVSENGTATVIIQGNNARTAQTNGANTPAA
jgi:hypothetical protein